MLKYTYSLYSQLYKQKPVAQPEGFYLLCRPGQKRRISPQKPLKSFEDGKVAHMISSNQILVSKFRIGMNRLRQTRNSIHSSSNNSRDFEREDKVINHKQIQRTCYSARRPLENKQNLCDRTIQIRKNPHPYQKRPILPQKVVNVQKPNSIHENPRLKRKEQNLIKNLDSIQNRIGLALNKQIG